MTRPTLGFAGLGAMGGGMASQLVASGFVVHGYDVHQPSVDSFASKGGHAAKSPREAAEKADIFISMVANAAQNSSLLFDGDDCVIRSLGQGKIFMLCSTTAPSFPEDLRRLLDQHNRADVRLLDCPVSGGTIRAADGTLSIFASGAEEDLTAAQAVLESISGNLYRMGPISAGTKTKTVHQLMAATNIISASEAMGLAATVGLNTQAVMDAVVKSEGNSFMFANRVPHQLSGDNHVYSALGIILKDTVIVNDTARQERFPAALASTAEWLYLRGVDAGLLSEDDSKLVQLYLPTGQGDLVQRKTEADVMMRASHQVSHETVVALLAGIHLAASVEAMAFCKHLGMDRHIMFDIISKAAGWSAMFTGYMGEMLANDEWSLGECSGAVEVGQRLEEAVSKCQRIRYPCPMATVALQQYHFARLATSKA